MPINFKLISNLLSKWRSYLFMQMASEDVIPFGCIFPIIIQQIWNKNINDVWYTCYDTMPYLGKGIYDDKLLA